MKGWMGQEGGRKEKRKEKDKGLGVKKEKLFFFNKIPDLESPT